MAGDLTLALRTSRTGLLTNQLALNTVANNVSNVNSPGYSRRIVNLEERVLTGTGAGVQLSAITRSVDELLMQTLRIEQSRLSEMTSQSATFSRMQSLFGKPADNNSISHTVAEFVAAAESLAQVPHGNLEQQAFVLRGRDIADQVASMSQTIQDLRQQADAEISGGIDVLNANLETIAELNREIVATRVITRDAIGLEDQRDQALDALAKMVDIRTFPRDNGSLMVFTANGQVLVDNVAVTVTHDPAGTVSAATNHASGAFNPIAVGTGGTSRDITTDLPSGELAGLVELRDNLLPSFQSSLDELTATLADTVNAVHNRGVAFPGLSSMTGSRVFVDTTAPSSHQITVDAMPPGSDTVIALMDANGDQLASTTLRSVMTAATGAATGPWRIDQISGAVEGWLQGATTATGSAAIGFDAEGRMTVDLNTSAAFLAFRDVDSAGDPADLVIKYDSDADGAIDETVSGFSNFFGLNDFFTDGRRPTLWESDVLTSPMSLAANTTLSFQTSTGTQTVALAAGDSLATVADKINAGGVDVGAVIVPDGAGSRLRLIAGGNSPMAITDGGTGFLSTIGLHQAEVGVASTLSVRSDIVAVPGLIATGALQFDPNRGTAGEYFVSVGDDTVAQQLAAAFGEPVGFDTAGSIKASTVTFVDYAAALIGDVSIQAATLDQNADFQQSLVDGLQTDSDAIRGVNLDEEMSNLILYEQAYNSAARIITVIREMFDTLQNAVT